MLSWRGREGEGAGQWWSISQDSHSTRVHCCATASAIHQRSCSSIVRRADGLCVHEYSRDQDDVKARAESSKWRRTCFKMCSSLIADGSDNVAMRRTFAACGALLSSCTHDRQMNVSVRTPTKGSLCHAAPRCERLTVTHAMRRSTWSETSSTNISRAFSTSS